MQKKLLTLLWVVLSFATALSQTQAVFTVRIENVSTDSTLRPSDGSMQPVPMSPGVWAVHTTSAPLFTPGQPDRGDGLEAIAEDGSPVMLADALAMQSGIFASNVFNTPVDADAPGPLLPGGSYEFTFMAKPGTFLSFATMFVPSNDLFFGPDENGIALFDENGAPIAGEVTGQIMLWDAGTEANEEPGVGANQVQRQSGPNTGPADPDSLVRLVSDGFTYPEVAEVIRVTIVSVLTSPFTIRIESMSTDSTLMPSDGSKQPVPLSPGVWAVHAQSAPLFMDGQADRSDGLEAIAEDGSPGTLADVLANQSGILSSDIFNMPKGAVTPGPLLPGGSYEFTVYAAPGGRLVFATMFVPSNDLFFSPNEEGIALFDEQGIPVSGDVTDQLALWDAGTEANEEPGVGPNQVQRQSGPNTGPADPDSLVRLVNDGFTYPALADVIRLTINPATPVPFTVRIENVSTDSTLRPPDLSKQPVPLSPGVWAVHTQAVPLFTAGDPDRGKGLESIAEDGDPGAMAAALINEAGVVASDLFNTPVGASGPGPLLPDGAYEFSFEATPGSFLSFATMFVPSNDLFYAPEENGIALFDAQGQPVSGEVTALVMLWDAGTEANEDPGVGPNQVQRQSAPNTGPADPNNIVRLMDDGFTYPAVTEVIRVIINPEPTSVERTSGEVPTSFRIEQNYPNPFNPETTIIYKIGDPGPVKVTIYNALGQQIRSLVDEIQDVGEYRVSWNGKNDRGVGVSSGIYFYRFETRGFQTVRKMTLLR